MELLSTAPYYMHGSSKLILPVNSLSFYIETLNYVSRKFNTRIIEVFEMKSKEFVYEFEDFFRGLNREGKIKLFKKSDRWYHMIYIVELSLK